MNESIRTIDRDIDLDVVFLQFADLYEHDAEEAYRCLQSLFLDEAACRARIAFLREIADRAKQKWSADTKLDDDADTARAASDETKLVAGSATRPVGIDSTNLAARPPGESERMVESAEQVDFTKEIRIIAEVGPTPAIQKRRITAERMHALTCDPDALWQAYETLRGGEGQEEHTIDSAVQQDISFAVKDTEIASSDERVTTIVVERQDEPETPGTGDKDSEAKGNR